MRPLKLELQAFGPFKDKVVINFTHFLDQGLFLITGTTGSGKTSLFDAILYALYGQLSNSDKNLLGANTIKSQHADDNTLSYVQLEFESRSNIYTIYRQPAQKVMGKRGRYIDDVNKVKLSSQTLLLEKSEEVKKEIEEIIGLNADQFKQIVLLPQGEFKKLLFSASNEKEKIFRDIFETQAIEKFTLDLKSSVDELRKQNTHSLVKLKALLSSVNQVDERLENLIELEQFDEILGILDHSIQANQQAIKNYHQQLDTLEKQMNQVTTQLQIEKEIKQYQMQVQQFEEQHERLQQLAASINKGKLIIEALKLKTEVKQDELKIEIINNDISQLIKEEQETLKDIDKGHNERVLNQKDLELIPSWKKEIETTQLTLNQIEKMNSLIYKEENIKKSEQSFLLNIDHLKSKKQKNQTQLEDILIKLNDINQAEINLIEVTKTIDELKKKSESYINRLNQLNKIDKLIQQRQVENETFKQYSNSFTLLSKQVSDAQIRYHSQQAALLAKDLQAGQPCPVCGSIHHPAPTTLSEESVTQQEVDALYQKLQEVLAKKSSSQQLKDSLNQQIQTECELLNIEETAVKSQIDLIQSLQVITNKEIQEEVMTQNKLNQLIQQKEAYSKQKETLEKQDQQFELEIASILGQVNELDNQLKEIVEDKKTLGEVDVNQKQTLLDRVITYQKRIDQATDNKDLIKDKLSALEIELTKNKSTQDVLQQNLLNQTQELKQLQQQFESYMMTHHLTLEDLKDKMTLDEIQKAEKEVSDFNVNYQTALKQLEASHQKRLLLEEVVDHPLDKEFELKQKRVKVNESLNKTQAGVDNQQHTYNLVQQENNLFKQIKEDLNQYGPLSDVALGNKENGYLSFERYVLSSYFEEVLHYANLRLYDMSQQRYKLVVATEVDSRKRSAGLDLEVFDHYTSSTRSVKSLSGGETFNASLSLALGLSDVISQKSGGIQLETLFIDEGFGALDAQALDLAIETLFELNQAGRVVGIISHVSELKERIPNQIQVEKSASGSSVKTIG